MQVAGSPRHRPHSTGTPDSGHGASKTRVHTCVPKPLVPRARRRQGSRLDTAVTLQSKGLDVCREMRPRPARIPALRGWHAAIGPSVDGMSSCGVQNARHSAPGSTAQSWTAAEPTSSQCDHQGEISHTQRLWDKKPLPSEAEAAQDSEKDERHHERERRHSSALRLLRTQEVRRGVSLC